MLPWENNFTYNSDLKTEMISNFLSPIQEAKCNTFNNRIGDGDSFSRVRRVGHRAPSARGRERPPRECHGVLAARGVFFGPGEQRQHVHSWPGQGSRRPLQVRRFKVFDDT